jgi:hypothetical protein
VCDLLGCPFLFSFFLCLFFADLVRRANNLLIVPPTSAWTAQPHQVNFL